MMPVGVQYILYVKQERFLCNLPSIFDIHTALSTVELCLV